MFGSGVWMEMFKSGVWMEMFGSDVSSAVAVSHRGLAGLGLASGIERKAESRAQLG